MRNGISYEEYLSRYNNLTYANVGVSMLPLLHPGRDLFTVAKKDEKRCKVGDVVLYRRLPEHYVLHRIIRVCKEDYILMGDNCVQKEYGIRDDDIIGVMTGFVRNGKSHSITEKGYRMYVFVWLRTIYVRTLLKRIKSFLKPMRERYAG